MNPGPVLSAWLKETLQRNASDLHLVVGTPPTVRVNGKLEPLPHEALSAEAARGLIYGLLSPDQRHEFERAWELDFAFSVPEVGRFRANVYAAQGNVEAAFRAVALKPQSLKALGLPPVVEELSRRHSGLILVTGAAGQGKTTTLAAMIDQINRGERQCRIITIEDPIEYLHRNLNSVVIQREVGSDTRSFNGALVHALRQDPNVICIGEMRDLETISTALTAAETGHLVLATLHSPGALQTIERVVDVFPPAQQSQIRVQLASSIEGLVTQRLLPRADGQGRVLAMEILVGEIAVRNIIRDARIHQLTTYLNPSMDKSLKELFQAGLITYETAMANVRDIHAFENA